MEEWSIVAVTIDKHQADLGIPISGTRETTTAAAFLPEFYPWRPTQSTREAGLSTLRANGPDGEERIFLNFYTPSTRQWWVWLNSRATNIVSCSESATSSPQEIPSRHWQGTVSDLPIHEMQTAVPNLSGNHRLGLVFLDPAGWRKSKESKARPCWCKRWSSSSTSRLAFSNTVELSDHRQNGWVCGMLSHFWSKPPQMVPQVIPSGNLT